MREGVRKLQEAVLIKILPHQKLHTTSSTAFIHIHVVEEEELVIEGVGAAAS